MHLPDACMIQKRRRIFAWQMCIRDRAQGLLLVMGHEDHGDAQLLLEFLQLCLLYTSDHFLGMLDP